MTRRRMSIQLVWFKRDLRREDHAPLYHALRAGPVLPLYILEPDYWQQPDLSARHYQFCREALVDLRDSLSAQGLRLILRIGYAPHILASLIDEMDISAVHAHEETGNGWSYQRDEDVRQMAREKGVIFHEYRQFGVIRGLKSRNGWAAKWAAQMRSDCLQPDFTQLSTDPNISTLASEGLPSAARLGLAPMAGQNLQLGGRQEGLAWLKSFLTMRGQFYRGGLSSPLSAQESGGRLSPYFSFGCLSMREVYQSVLNRQEALRGLPKSPETTRWRASLKSFASRLHWHCHFIQKLEDEPAIEWQHFHAAYDGLRGFDAARFAAWAKGRTGYPFIDACMRSLIATGWLNFRMRAMLMSFAAYHLWLDWRAPAVHLARLFTDYEPGIHYSQCQMQSGTTGINVMRIYNPIKQSQDQDPDGVFIRRWLPELKDLPTHLLHTPWLVPHRLNGYPMPIVEEAPARRAAADKLAEIRKQTDHRTQAAHIVSKHGSRKAGLPQTHNQPRGKRNLKTPTKPAQPDLPF
ncbi:MAG: FAD-binding domain-containing protein [Candidatus Puniceispirillaceae bacterium]